MAGARALPALPGWAGLHRTDRNAKLKEESAVIYWTGAKNQGQSDSIACVFFRADKIYEGKAIGVESEAVRETENRCLERREGRTRLELQWRSAWEWMVLAAGCGKERMVDKNKPNWGKKVGEGYIALV